MIIENVFDCPPVQHVAMEPHVCVAEWRDGRLTLWDSTQAPNWVQTEVANTCRVSTSDVRVIVPTLGGGYGAKIDPSIEPIAALLARKARRPVRLALHRDEEFFTHTKHGARVRIRTGAKRDGTLVAHQATCWYNGGAYSKETPEKITRGYASMGPYRVPNIYVESFGVYTNVTPSAAFRGFGIPQVSWAHESQMDELGEHAGHGPAGAAPAQRAPRGRHVLDRRDDPREHALRGAAAAGRREGRLGRRRRRTDARVSGEPGHGVVRARGVAAIIKGMSAFPSSSVAKLNTDGSMNVLTGSVEMGQGALTALAQIVSDESTIPVSRVRISTPDTAVTPWDQMSAASRTTNNMGKAMRAAVVDVKQQLLRAGRQAARDLRGGPRGRRRHRSAQGHAGEGAAVSRPSSDRPASATSSAVARTRRCRTWTSTGRASARRSGTRPCAASRWRSTRRRGGCASPRCTSACTSAG